MLRMADSIHNEGATSNASPVYRSTLTERVEEGPCLMTPTLAHVVTRRRSP